MDRSDQLLEPILRSSIFMESAAKYENRFMSLLAFIIIYFNENRFNYRTRHAIRFHQEPFNERNIVILMLASLFSSLASALKNFPAI